MFFELSLDQKFQQQQRKIAELAIQMEKLDLEIDSFLKELKVTPAQLSTFISQQENFTPQNWEELAKQQKQIDEKLHRDLSQIRNPKKTKKAYDSLRIERHWIRAK